MARLRHIFSKKSCGRSSVTRCASHRRRAAFTLIEVLVAMTILTIIVMMVAMVFQQSSLAWQSGMRRAEGGMTVRALLGVIQRELSQAVDARGFEPRSFDQYFDQNRVRFVVIVSDVEDASRRSPRMIEFRRNGPDVERSEWTVRWNGTQWTSSPLHTGVSLNEDMGLENFRFDIAPNPADPDGLPLYVEVMASISQEGDVSTVGAWSYGPLGASAPESEWITSW